MMYVVRGDFLQPPHRHYKTPAVVSNIKLMKGKALRKHSLHENSGGGGGGRGGSRGVQFSAQSGFGLPFSAHFVNCMFFSVGRPVFVIYYYLVSL